MATLYISEFAGKGKDANGIPMDVPELPALARQTVAISGTSAQSATFHKDTTFVRVHTDIVCSILAGTNPTATATDARMAAGQTEYFGVQKNSGVKIAVISNS